MPLPRHQDRHQLDDRLRNAYAVTADMMSEVVRATCQRLETPIQRLIQSGAWIDAMLALVELELPQWQLRRIVYDAGEWYCTLSRERELPEWLDQTIETHHTNLPLAILSAFIDARRNSAWSKTSVPARPLSVSVNSLCEPVCCDNFA